MATIDFLKFNQKPSAIKGADAAAVKQMLNENLKNHLLAIVPVADKVFFKQMLQTVSIDAVSLKEKTLQDLINDNLLAHFPVDVNMKRILAGLSNELRGNTGKIGDILGLDLPLKNNPAFTKDYNSAKTKALGTILNLPATALTKLSENDADIDDFDEQSIKKLGTDKVITPAQVAGLKLVIDLSRLSNANVDFITAFHNDTAAFDHFIEYDPANWVNVLSTKHISIPAEEDTINSYAQSLAKNIELSFPKAFFLARINKKDFTPQLNTFNSLERISALGNIKYKGSNIILDDIKWTGINEEEKKRLLNDMQNLQVFAHTYRYLDLTQTLAKNDITIAAKKEAVQKKLDQLKIFYKNNEQLDLMEADFFDAAVKPDYTGIDESNKPLVKKQAMAYQRMLLIGSNTKTTQQLLAKGFSSSWDIIHAGEKDFVNTAGLELNEAKGIYTSALDTVTSTSHLLQAIRDTQRGGFGSLAVNNLGQIVNDLKAIDGYSEIFGSQDFCQCDHCRSIFSPAAYFTDLMFFIEEHVTGKFFTGPNSASPLKLKKRRPDLWKVALSCQNTSTEIPYLDVVNDVLEQYVKSGLGNNEVYGELSISEVSCGLPFNLPLEELRTYLGHFQFSLSRLYQLLDEEAGKQSQEKLLLSDKELAMITTPDPAKALIRLGSPPNLNTIKINDFVRLSGISRTDFDAMIELKSIPELGSLDIKVIESTADIQQYTEVFKTNSLTLNRVDLSDRFLRLWKKTNWTIGEFDMVLGSLKDAGLFSTLEEKDEQGHFKLLVLADVSTAQAALKLNVEELCAVIDEIPVTALNTNDKGLYERLFNLKEIFGINTATNQYNTEATLNNNKADDKITPHLLAGLSINEHELNMLFKLLGINNIDSPVLLNKTVISRLYRQSRLATGLKLSIEAFVAAVTTFIGNTGISSLAQVIQMIEYKRWLETTPFKFQHIDFILNGTESLLNKYEYSQEKVKAIITEMKAASVISGIALTSSSLENKIQGIFSISPVQLTGYLSFVTIQINDPLIVAALNSDLTNPADLAPIVSLLNELERKIFCFDKLKWQDNDILFLTGNPAVFGITDIKNLKPVDVNAIISFSSMFVNLTEENKEDTRKLLQENSQLTDFNETGINLLATLWSYSPALLHSIISNCILTGTLPGTIEKLYQLANICYSMGIQADSLIKLKDTDYAGLTSARNIVYGAMASKYADEKTRIEKLEAYHDRINTRKRNALCDYIIAQRDKYNFKDRSDLYNFFLLDVEMSGCFRTSRLLAAISSTQLYIHRCLLSLERSETNIAIAIPPGAIPADEWEWRKNYRVWEANRKVFLYPENYIDPALRDTETPLFKELEDELLQQNITMDSAENSYKKYLAQFLELSHLRYAGAYYNYVDNNPIAGIETSTFDSNHPATMSKVVMEQAVKFTSPFVDKDKTIYYFFARTYIHPYQYYYRTFNKFKKLWGHWQKIDLPIEAEEVSAIIHNGKLHVYWTEVQRKEINTIVSGGATSQGAVFKITVKYSLLDSNNKWSAPQHLFLGRIQKDSVKICDRLVIEPNDDLSDLILDKFQLEVFRKPYVVQDVICQ